MCNPRQATPPPHRRRNTPLASFTRARPLTQYPYLPTDPSKGTSTSSGEWSRCSRPPTTAPTPAAAAAAAATGDDGGEVKRHAPDSSQRLGRMSIVTGDGRGGGGGSDDDDRGGGNGGGAALFDAHAAALQHDMQALSIDDEPSPGWSQLRTDVAGYVRGRFGIEAASWGRSCCLWYSRFAAAAACGSCCC